MNNTVRIILSAVMWCALAAYLIFAVRLCSHESRQTMLSGVEVRVLDADRLQLITPETVKRWLAKGDYDFGNIELGKVDTENIRAYIQGHAFIKNVRVYTDMDGMLYIEVTQRRPVARVNTYNGYNFYISDDDWILPVEKGGGAYVPIITGTLSFPFGHDFSGSIRSIAGDVEKKGEQNYLYLLKLINFVKSVKDDPFWDAQIVQINVAGRGASALGNAPEGAVWYEPEVEIVPRVGNHTILLGSLDDAREKLDKLMLFYRKVLDTEGWDSYRTINLSYKGQIVCRR